MVLRHLFPLFLTMLAAFVSCEQNPAGPSDLLTPQDSLALSKKHIHGTWRNIVADDVIRFVVFDTVSSFVSEKRDYGYNFRSELSSFASIKTGYILWGVGDGSYEPWFWYAFNSSFDTLTLSYDSLMRSPMHFTKDSLSLTNTQWIRTLTSTQITSYPNIVSWVQALAYANDYWYVLTSTGNGDGALRKINVLSGVDSTFGFPSATACEIADGYLWLSGKFYLEKRNLTDTTLIVRYDISQYFASNGGNHWIQGMTILDSTIYLMTSFGRFLVFSTAGVFVQERSTYLGLDDLMIHNGRLWGVTTSSEIHEIDLSTTKAKGTYYLGFQYSGRSPRCRFTKQQDCVCRFSLQQTQDFRCAISIT